MSPNIAKQTSAAKTPKQAELTQNGMPITMRVEIELAPRFTTGRVPFPTN